MSKSKKFVPDWYHEKAPERSYRSILKWGDPEAFKAPNTKLYELMKETFHMTDDDFKVKQEMGLEEVDYDIPCRLSNDQIAALEAIVGKANVSTDNYDRLSVAYGKTMVDLMRLRKHIVENVPDAVVYPKNREDIIALVKYCCEQKIPMYVYGGGSSVTRGVEAVKGGITLDMRKNFNKVISFSEHNQTITVEAGMSGPKLEETLNNAVSTLGAKRAYTCGHFPQSFEYSSVGGWAVTRGAGQNSSYYGKIEDIVISQEYVTPIGIIKSDEFPRNATGPSIDQIMMGSEGTFGILTHVTLRVFKYMPENRKKFSYVFKDWENGLNAAREIMQGEFGFPSVFRLSDPEETSIAFRLYGVADTVIDKMLAAKGYKDGKRVLMLDMDIGLRSLDLIFGTQKDVLFDWGNVIDGGCEPNQAALAAGGPMLMTAPMRMSDSFTKENMKELADKLAKDYDYIFFDAPAGLSDGFELACAAADRGIVVSTADAVCVRSVNITAGAMRKLGLSDIRLVINRFDEKAVCKKKLLNIDDVIDAVCVQLIGIVPEDAAVSHCAVRGEPLPASSAAAKAFSRIAKRIDGGEAPLLG